MGRPGTRIIGYEPPKVTPIGPREFRLTEPYALTWVTSSDQGFQIVVPEGFNTNFASLPDWLFRLTGIPSSDYDAGAFVAHDYIWWKMGVFTQKDNDYRYYDQFAHRWTPLSTRFTPKESNKLMKHTMEAAGDPAWMCHAFYWGVELFPNKHW